VSLGVDQHHPGVATGLMVGLGGAQVQEFRHTGREILDPEVDVGL
jgi:hypothetical protein